MPANQFVDVSLTGSVTVVPPKVRSIEEDVDLFGGNIRQIERLKKTLSLNERRIASKELRNLDLCEQAASRSKRAIKINSNDLDGILYVTQTPDHSQPSNATLLQWSSWMSNELCSLRRWIGLLGLCLCTLVGLFNYSKWVIAKVWS